MQEHNITIFKKMKMNKILTCISILLLVFLVIDLIVFRINTMPRLTHINHLDFIEEANNIKDLDVAKVELKKWIDKRYSSVERENTIYLKYLYFIISLLLIEILKFFFRKKNNV